MGIIIKNNLKRALAVTLSVILALSSFAIGVSPIMNANAAQISSTARGAFVNNGTRGSSSKITVCNDGTDNNFSAGVFKFDVPSINDEYDFDSVNLNFGTIKVHNNISGLNVEFYAVDASEFSFTSGTYNYVDVSGYKGTNAKNQFLSIHNITSDNLIYTNSHDDFSNYSTNISFSFSDDKLTKAINSFKSNNVTSFVIVALMSDGEHGYYGSNGSHRTNGTWTDIDFLSNPTLSYEQVEVAESETKYIFDATNASRNNLDTPQQISDTVNNTHMVGCQWGAKTNGPNYIELNNATMTSGTGKTDSTANRIGDAITNVKGKKWSFSIKYQWDGSINGSNKSGTNNSTVFGIGSHNIVTATNNSAASNNDGLKNSLYGTDLIQVTKNKNVYINGSASSSGTVSNDVTSSFVMTLEFMYDNGTIKVNIDGVTSFTKDISADNALVEKFEAGPGNYFICSSCSNLAGGTLRYLGPSNNDVCFDNYKVYIIKGKTYTVEEPQKELTQIPDPADTDVPDTFTPDAQVVKNAKDAMTAFENKVKNGGTTFYNGLFGAYNSYVNLQKAYDAVVYGHDSSIDLSAKVTALNTAINSMSEWTGKPYYRNNVPFSSTYSADNGYSNAIYIVSNPDRYFNGVGPNGVWCNIFVQDAIYVYDGETTPTIPIMALTEITNTNNRYVFGIYPTGSLTNGLTLQGNWHTAQIINSANNRNFDYSWKGNDRVSTSYTCPQSDTNIVGKKTNNTSAVYYHANKINVDGSKIFSNNSSFKQQLSISSNWAFHDGENYNSNWVETVTGVNPTIYILNYKGVKDLAVTKNDLFKNVANYKEGGLQNAAEALNKFVAISFSGVASMSGADTIATALSNANTAFGYSSSSEKTDSTDYANIRKALDRCTVTSNANCYTGYDAYLKAKTRARGAMCRVTSAGYTTTNYDGKTLATIANELNDAVDHLTQDSQIHLYRNTGVIDRANNRINYTCVRNANHIDSIDASTYFSAIETLAAESLKIEKYTESTIKEIKKVLNQTSISPSGANAGDSSEVYVAYDDIENTLEEHVNTILALIYRLQTVDDMLNKLDFTYSYVYNDATIKKSGTVQDAIYGKLLTDSYYDITSSQHIVKWTESYIDENGVRQNNVLYNTTTKLNYIPTHNNAQLICYIEEDKDISNQVTVQFVDRAQKIKGIIYLTAGDELNIDSDGYICKGSTQLYQSESIPYYDAREYWVNGKAYSAGDTITITSNTNIYSKYTVKKPIKITTEGGDSTINNQDITSYDAKWDELITIRETSSTADFYWFINGVLCSRGKFISFRANKDANVTKVNAQSYDIKNDVEIYDIDRNAASSTVTYFDYDVELNKVTAVVTFAAFNTNYELINDQVTEAGVYLSTTASDPTAIKSVGKKFSSIKKTDTKNQVKISVSRTANTSFNMYALPYVVINDHTYYGKKVATINYKA